MNARYTLIQNLRQALGDAAERVSALLAPARPAAVPARRRVEPVVLARRFAFVAALAAAGSLAGAAQARDEYGVTPSDLWADGNLVDVQIKVDGAAAPLYVSPRGDRRHYFEAFAGRNYSVVLRNNTGRRIGVLLTVDGLNVVNGEITRQAHDEPMYVLGPWESATIRGWRTSLDEVRRFVFVDEKRSYASRTGQANDDMGWIRVLAFREKQSPKPWGWNERQPAVPRTLPWFDSPGERAKGERDELRSEDRHDQAPRAQSEREGAAAPAPTAQRLDGARKQQALNDAQGDGGSYPGTGWGDRRTDRVNQVDFTAERGATDLLVFRYEYARGLLALGIHPRGDRLGERDRGGLVGFARPPRW